MGHQETPSRRRPRGRFTSITGPIRSRWPCEIAVSLNRHATDIVVTSSAPQRDDTRSRARHEKRVTALLCARPAGRQRPHPCPAIDPVLLHELTFLHPAFVRKSFHTDG
jgi:hypothetical protein